jgi:hypothetical protein
VKNLIVPEQHTGRWCTAAARWAPCPFWPEATLQQASSA